MKRKLWIAAVVLLLAVLWCGAALADYSGTCGDNITWVFDTDNGKLSFLGSGDMTNYSGPSAVPWYAYRTSVKSIIINSGVTSLSRWAFSGCTGVTSVRIPASVTTIGYLAFDGCSNLSEATILGRSTVIGDNDYDVFRNCASGFTLRGWSDSTAKAYASAADYTYTQPKCGGNATCNLDTSGRLAIYGSGEMANFQYYYEMPWDEFREEISSIVISGSVSSISNGAFIGCSNLTSVTIPIIITKIGYYAFSGCSNLSEVFILNSSTVIGTGGSNVFDGCASDLTITGWLGSTAETYAAAAGHPFVAMISSGECGDNVTWSLNESASELTLSGTGATWNYPGDCPEFYTARGTITKITIEDGVTGIGNWLFYGMDKVTYVRIPDSVTKIGNYAFQNCSSLTSATIPRSVTEIGYCAFINCSSLTSVTIPRSVTSIGNAVFENCSSLKKVSIFNPTISIGESVFRNCASDLVIGSYTGSAAQTYASGNSITFNAWPVAGMCGDSVVWSFDTAACRLTISGAGKMTDYPDQYDFPWYSYKDEIVTVIIGQGVKSVGNYAFFGCYYMTDVTIPDSVTRIGVASFDCCLRLENVTIPDSVTVIDWCAFNTCNTLTSITIPNSVTNIELQAFANCRNLSKVTLSNSLTRIEYMLFANCVSLTSITIPNSVTTISNQAFENSALTSVTIPSSVTSIGNQAFKGCSGLKKATVYNLDTTLGTNVFADCASGITIYGWPYSTARTYAANNSHAFQALTAPDPAFFLPAGLKSIDDEAFSGIKAKAVVIPKTVTTISGNPFAGSGVICIYGYYGSAADTLATNNGYYFVGIDDAWMKSHKP